MTQELSSNSSKIFVSSLPQTVSLVQECNEMWITSSIKSLMRDYLPMQQIYDDDNGSVKLPYAGRTYLPEKEEKRNWYLIIELLAIIAIVYIWWIFN